VHRRARSRRPQVEANTRAHVPEPREARQRARLADRVLDVEPAAQETLAGVSRDERPAAPPLYLLRSVAIETHPATTPRPRPPAAQLSCRAATAQAEDEPGRVLTHLLQHEIDYRPVRLQVLFDVLALGAHERAAARRVPRRLDRRALGATALVLERVDILKRDAMGLVRGHESPARRLRVHTNLERVLALGADLSQGIAGPRPRGPQHPDVRAAHVPPRVEEKSLLRAPLAPDAEPRGRRSDVPAPRLARRAVLAARAP